MLTLNGYDNSNGDAAGILYPTGTNVTVLNTDSVDVTQYLLSNRILRKVLALLDYHGWISNQAIASPVNIETATATALDVTGKFVLMSDVQNAGETPILFARIENSSNLSPLTQSDVDSVVYTINKFTNASIRGGSSGKTPVSADWTDVSVPVSDCILDSPVSDDPRVSFEYNFKFEPNTLTDNPFASSGSYSVDFVITPANGNKIPLNFEFTLK